jgi:hypothetical protein
MYTSTFERTNKVQRRKIILERNRVNTEEREMTKEAGKHQLVQSRAGLATIFSKHSIEVIDSDWRVL